MTSAPDVDLAAIEPEDLAGGDPALLGRLLAERPVHRSPSGVVCLARHDDVLAALRDPTLVAPPAPGSDLPEGAARSYVASRLDRLPPAEHARVRGALSAVFAPHRVAELRGRVESVAAGLLDVVAAQAVALDSVDVVAALAAPLPVASLCELLGIERVDASTMADLAAGIAPLLDPDAPAHEREAAAEAAERFAGLVRVLVGYRRISPRRDLLSELVAAAGPSGPLTDAELTAVVMTLFVAGSGPPCDLVSSALLALAGDRGQWRLLGADPGLSPAAVEESLRLHPPVPVVRRVASEEVVVRGERVAAGTPMALVLAAANRDPAVWPDPDRFDMLRTPVRSLSFAAGAHACIGATLARMEADVALRAVVARWPAISVAEPGGAVRRPGAGSGLAALRLRLGR